MLDRETDQWGVKVERVEIKEVDPIGAVKQAMTEQTAAGGSGVPPPCGEKRSAILRAEGLRQSTILEAEGERQAKILRAEGERQSRILEAQGQAQGLRIVALGAKPLDRRSITVSRSTRSRRWRTARRRRSSSRSSSRA